MSNTITNQDFQKSLSKLEALAKGSDAAATDEAVNKAQICTGPGNEPSSWSGGDKEKYGEGWDDSIGSDGTDYKAGSKARKSIAEKVMSGQALSKAELAVLNADLEKGMKKADDEDEDEGEEEEAPEVSVEVEGKEKSSKACKKSFAESVQENETLQKGIEVSDFLAEFAKSFGVGLQALEQRVTDKVVSTLRQDLGNFAKEQGEFNKSLADAVVNIGNGLSGAIQAQAAVSEAPAGPPRSQIRAQSPEVQVLNKGQNAGESLSKSQILDAMSEMVTKGHCSPLDVIKFESTGTLPPQLHEKVIKSIG